MEQSRGQQECSGPGVAGVKRSRGQQERSSPRERAAEVERSLGYRLVNDSELSHELTHESAIF